MPASISGQTLFWVWRSLFHRGRAFLTHQQQRLSAPCACEVIYHGCYSHLTLLQTTRMGFSYHNNPLGWRKSCAWLALHLISEMERKHFYNPISHHSCLKPPPQTKPMAISNHLLISVIICSSAASDSPSHFWTQIGSVCFHSASGQNWLTWPTPEFGRPLKPAQMSSGPFKAGPTTLAWRRPQFKSLKKWI